MHVCTCTHSGEPVGVLEYEHVCVRRATLKPGRDLLVAKCESALSKETTSTWLCQVGQEKALISQLPSATARSSNLFVFRLVSRQPGWELRGEVLAGAEDHVLVKGFPGSSKMERRHSLGVPGRKPFPIWRERG